MLSLAILYSVSLIDDIKNLSASSRLFVHFISVAISIFALKSEITFFMDNNVSSWINYDPLVIFYIIWSSDSTVDLDNKSFNLWMVWMA